MEETPKQEGSNFFTKLQKLFSTDVVIHNTGNNQLKVVDINDVQRSGELATNSLYDKYNKVYTTSGRNQYNHINQVPTSRVQLYTDYEAMDTDSIVASTLDIIADEVSLRNDFGETLQIRSSDETMQKILYNLFYDVLNIEFNLWSWTRNMCKYGDFYLKLEISEKYGVYNVIPFSSYTIIRLEGENLDNPMEVKFRYDPTFTSQQSPYGHQQLAYADSSKKIEFKNYEMAHFRLLADYNYLPYGRCLSPDSRITTENSIKEIKDIVKGDKVWTFNIEENKYELANVLATVNSGIKKIYNVKTVHNEIKGSDNHPLLVWDFDKEKPEYKQIKDLKKGDYLCAYKNADIKLSNPKLNKTLFELGPHDWKCDLTSVESFPDIVTPEFARFWGFMLGDGWQNGHVFGFARGINDERNEYYENLLKKFSGKEKLGRLYSKTSNVPDSGVIVTSKVFHHFMTINGYTGKSYSKRLPNWIYECDEETQLSLVKGLMDADGYIFTDKWNCNSYNLSLNNKELLKDLKSLLDRAKIKTGTVRARKFTGKCNILGKEYNAKQSYDFTFYLDGKRKQQYAKYDKINSLYNVELFKIKSITEELPEETYDIQVSKNSNFIADGIIVHNSYLEPARKIFKQLSLMEDAMLIHRIVRAPEKRTFFINVGNIPPNEVEQYMQKTINKMKKTPYVDPKTGEYNLKYNVQNILEDFYIPVRGNDNSTKIDTTKGLEYMAIDDVNYLKEKLFAALKIPKAYLGFEKDLSGKCVSPETKIPLLDGRILTVGKLIEEYNNGNKNYVYSLDEKTNNIVPGEIEWAGYTRLNTQIMRVWLDNEKYIDCTPDHNFLTRNGEWKEAQTLSEGESLMPLYLQKSTQKKINGYFEVYNPSTGKYIFVHRLVAEYYGLKEKDKVIHHSDCNKLNNNPENLDCNMDFWEHRQWHVDHAMLCHTDEANIKRKNTWIALSKDSTYRESQKEVWKNNSNNLVNWIKENGASRKGFRKNLTGICVGCKNEFDKTILTPEQQNNLYCSQECRNKFWKSKYNSITVEQLEDCAINCKNFKELKDLLGIKDHSTLNKVFINLGIDKEDFILSNMPLSHSNSTFMNQFSKTNKFYNEGEYKNHKVLRIEWIDEKIDTCDLTISKYHNFGTEAGVIIHNSTLAAEDIRFARTVERIQKILISELTKIALVHLYAQGYDGEALTNFTLSLTTPSIIYDQERIALLKEKADLATTLIDNNILPTDWIYDNIFQFSQNQYEEYRDLIIEDKKRKFRISQIESEGNDPNESNEVYGTPSHLASIQTKDRYPGNGGVPKGYDPDSDILPDAILGRPKEKVSTYNTQASGLGKDRLGSYGMKKDNSDGDSINPPQKDGALRLENTYAIYAQNKHMFPPRKTKLFEESNMLSEDNILKED